jgi:protein required for attachment to host cells
MKITHGALVLVADGQKSLLFRNEGDEKYPVLQMLSQESIANPATREEGSDRPGRSFSSISRRRSSVGQTDWHRQTEERFARHVAGVLEDAAKDDDAELVIAAPPQFLGSLRDQLNASVKRRLVAEINKDLVHRETDVIAEAIARHPEKAPAP